MLIFISGRIDATEISVLLIVGVEAVITSTLQPASARASTW